MNEIQNKIHRDTRILKLYNNYVYKYKNKKYMESYIRTQIRNLQQTKTKCFNFKFFEAHFRWIIVM